MSTSQHQQLNRAILCLQTPNNKSRQAQCNAHASGHPAALQYTGQDLKAWFSSTRGHQYWAALFHVVNVHSRTKLESQQARPSPHSLESSSPFDFALSRLQPQWLCPTLPHATYCYNTRHKTQPRNQEQVEQTRTI